MLENIKGKFEIDLEKQGDDLMHVEVRIVDLVLQESDNFKSIVLVSLISFTLLVFFLVIFIEFISRSRKPKSDIQQSIAKSAEETTTNDDQITFSKEDYSR